MTLALAHSPALGHKTPRIAPPAPLRSDIAGFRQAARDCGIELMPWQETAAAYITAVNADGAWLYRECAVVVSRQQGKTELLLPFIVSRLRMGRRIMHTAQNRELPREVHGRVADFFVNHDPKALRKKPRYANGQEEIRLTNGGLYRVVAATRGGARGPANDDVIVDEVREQDDFGFIAAALPTTQARPNAQIIYLSNAGDDSSVVLNSIRDRADSDPSLAYLEWSASPDREASDREGWLEANPAIGHMPRAMENLEEAFRRFTLSGRSAIFETEHLCRWVPTMRPRLVDDFAWMRCRTSRVSPPHKPALGISYDGQAKRASVVASWRTDDGRIALRELFDVAVDDSGIEALGADVMRAARKLGATGARYDDATDRDLARQLTGYIAKNVRACIGKDFANACEAFVRAIETDQLRWIDCDHVTKDLASTSRKENDEAGTFTAVRSLEDVPITASLAAIRAFWLATAQPQPGSLKVM